MPRNNILPQIKSAIKINIDYLIEDTIRTTLSKWRSNNNYIVIADEILRIRGDDYSRYTSSYNPFFSDDSSREEKSKEFFNHHKEMIIEEFRYDNFNISRDKLKYLLDICLRECDIKSSKLNLPFNTVLNHLYSSECDSVKVYVKTNKEELFTLIKQELETEEFNYFKKEFKNVQQDLARSFEEDLMLEAYQYLSHIMLCIDQIMAPKLKQLQTEYFTNYAFIDETQISFTPSKVDYQEISKRVLNYYKLYLPNNKLEAIIYPSKHPEREATTGNKLPEYIKGLISAGEFLTKDYQYKSDLQNFTEAFSKLQKYIFDQNSSISNSLDILLRSKHSYKITYSKAKEIRDLNNLINNYYDTKCYIKSYIYSLIDDYINLINEKIDSIKIGAICQEAISKYIIDLEDSLANTSSKLTANLDIIVDLFSQLNLLEPTIFEIRDKISNTLLSICELPFDRNIKTRILKYKDSLHLDLSANLVFKFKNEIIENKLKEYRARIEDTLEKNNLRIELFQQIYSEISIPMPKICPTHHELKGKINLKLPKILNNMLVYTAIFCINPDPDNKLSKRIFVSVPIRISEKASLHIPGSYSSVTDAVSNQNYNETHQPTQAQLIENLRNEDEIFIKTIADKAAHYTVYTAFDLKIPLPEEDQDKFNKIYGHSERVFTANLRKPEVVADIVKELENKIIDLKIKGEVKETKEPGTKHKVYAVTILAYSTNTVCQHCTRALIAQLNDTNTETSFLAQLDRKLNQSPLLRTSNKKTEQENDIRLKRSTIIIAGKEYKSDPHALMRKDFPQTDFVSRVGISRQGVLNLKTIPTTSFVELIGQIDPPPRRETNIESACASGSNLDQESRDSTIATAKSGKFILERTIDLKGLVI